MFDGYRFDLSGGRLPLDFANTLSRSTGDHLATYADLLSFVVQTGTLYDTAARRLLNDGSARPEGAAAVHARAIALRAAIFELSAAAVADRQPTVDAVAALNAELERSLARARVVPTEAGFEWGWDDAPDALDRPLWPIARAAAELLTDPDERPRVRLCAADNCDWLFLDLSKNRSRQWCDMKICGNRAKARRHYQRQRGGLRP